MSDPPGMPAKNEPEEARTADVLTVLNSRAQVLMDGVVRWYERCEQWCQDAARSMTAWWRSLFPQDDARLILGPGRLLPGRLRTTHAYVIGATRAGKSKALEGWLRQDIANGVAVCCLDPHGDLVNDLLAWMATQPDIDPARVILVDPANPSAIVGFNPLEAADGVPLYGLVMELVAAFKRLWADSWGMRLEEILRNTLLALASHGYTLVEAHALLTDDEFRAHCCEPPTPPATADYWRERFGPVPAKDKAVWIESTLNKINTFTADPLIRAIIGQRSTFNLRAAMDNTAMVNNEPIIETVMHPGAVVLVNLARGVLKDNAFLLGALLFAKLQATAMSRIDTPKDRRRLFAVYVDEFQAMASDSFGEVLAEAGKFGLALHLAHQNLAQLDERLRAAILGNCGTQVVFRVGREDGELLAKQLFPVTGDRIKRTERTKTGERYEIRYNLAEERELFTRALLDQAQRHFYARTPEGGPWEVASPAVEPARPAPEVLRAFIAASNSYYARPRADVEAELEARRQDIQRGRYRATNGKERHHDPHRRADDQRKAPRRPTAAEDIFGEDAAD